MTQSSALRLRLRPAQLFALAAGGIAILCAALVRARPSDLVAWGATFDLTLTIPLVYYFVVVRGGHARPITIAPVFVICVALATRLVPHGFAPQLRLVTVPLEVVTIGLVVARLRGAAPSDDPLERITSACRQIFGRSPAATVVAFEVTTLYYALFAWRKKTPREGWSVHERSGWGAIVFAFMIVIAGESTGMHFVIALWSPRVAWLWTALDLYAALWLIGDYHALRLRRTTLEAEALELRYGLRATATIPYSAIASVEPRQGEWQKRKGTLKVAIGDAPRTIIRLREPMTIQSIAGIRRTIDTIGILADDDGFEAALRAKLVRE